MSQPPAGMHRTLVLGLGITGYSCLRFLHDRCRVAVCDTREKPPFLDQARTQFADFDLIEPRAVDFAEFDRIVVSPGISLDHCLVTRARAAGIAVIGDIDLFFEQARAPVIGITGTNGKSTVTSLVGELLGTAFDAVRVGGNLGVPALDLLTDAAQRYVLELSSFQLERLHAGTFDIGSVLNVSADHLDRYASLDAYALAKRRVYRGCRAAVYDGADERTWPPSSARKIALGEDAKWRLVDDELILDGTARPLSAFRLQGRHNAQNLLAGCAIASLSGARVADMLQVLQRFEGLPHRCSPVGRIGSVRFIDDSKATNVGACLAALTGFGSAAKDIVLIAGGDGKGASFDPLRAPVSAYVRHVVLLGQDADRIDETLRGAVATSRVDDIDDAVREALTKAGDGGLVLLSPACASLDMFENFQARGDAFANAVARLGGVGD